MTDKKKEWFSEWFDSPYYHKLYKNRDDAEAQAFIKRLLDYLEPSYFSKVLDLACGRGRHSIFLHKNNLNVLGLDISPQSISHASEFETSGLRFAIHDMRNELPEAAFKFIFSFFTSFGYFEKDYEHQNAINHIANSLDTGGKFVIDFLNPYLVRKHLVLEEQKEIEGTSFDINRSYTDGFILKQISFTDDTGKKHNYTERVKGFNKADFDNMFEQAGLRTCAVFGDYQLGEFDEVNSQRMILIAEKK